MRHSAWYTARASCPGICGVSEQHSTVAAEPENPSGGSPDTFFLFDLTVVRSFSTQILRTSCMPSLSLRPLQLPKQIHRWWFSGLIPSPCTGCFFLPKPCREASGVQNRQGPGPRVRETEGRESSQGPTGARHPHAWIKPGIEERWVGGCGIWQIISLFLFRKSKASSEKVEFMGIQEGEVILNLHKNKLI